MPEEYDSIDSLAQGIISKLNSDTKKKKVIALYAFNATGKTRLANEFIEKDSAEVESLCYSAFFEDLFTWDNENYILRFDKNSWIIQLIQEQGLESDLVSNFKDITLSKIEPLFDFTKGGVTFKFASGDDKNLEAIKISIGEESVFVWSVFYTVIELAINTLNDSEENRATNIFDRLKYIVIDDPVSSMDDTRIITIAIRLVELVQSFKNNSVKFLITTHHALFFNVLVNSFKKKHNFEFCKLTQEDNIFKLESQDDSPFAYHLFLKETIKTAIFNKSIEKYHFNLFRNLLEKTANFLGNKAWGDYISGVSKKEFIRILNLYSHSKVSDLESKDVSPKDKEIFEQTFNTFIKEYFHETN